MSIRDAETMATTGRPPPDVQGRRGLTIGVLVVGLVVAGWWWASTPSMSSGGATGVWSADHEVHLVRGHGNDLHLVPADTPGETMLVLELTNEGRLPVTLVDVWPDTERPSCGWTPRVRQLRDDRRTMFTYDSPAREAVGATIPAGQQATVWLTGSQRDPSECVHAGMRHHEMVDVVVRVAGRTSTVSLPLGYAFGYTDDPRELTDLYGVTVQPPDPAVRVE